MQIIDHKYSSPWPKPSSFPAIFLTKDNWNDYGFLTSFSVSIQLTKHDERVELGFVKILEKNEATGDTKLPAGTFNSLGSQYCSLGQDYAYYEMLSSPRFMDFRDIYLKALRDVVYDDRIYEEFKTEPGFIESLLRQGSSNRALIDAKSLFGNQEVSSTYALEFETSVGGGEFVTRLHFSDAELLPCRLIAVIGANGAGKTQLLANLANVVNADSKKRSDPRFLTEYGEFLGSDPKFSTVLMVSYSAFDTFEIPRSTPLSNFKKVGRGLIYCGLRLPANEGGGESGSNNISQARPSNSEDSQRLKSITGITEDFLVALEVAKEKDRKEIFESVVSILAEEPSLKQLRILDLFDATESDAKSLFNLMSTGHKIVLNIITHLVAYLQPNSLLLIDEPESHLHPPLLSTLIHAISVSLKHFKSFGVIATHSPVVLQEIPKSNVRLLRRHGMRTTVNEPAIETFGESIGALTSHVFNLGGSNRDYQYTLEKLLRNKSIDQIDDLFELGLSNQAFAYLTNLQAEKEQNDS